MTNSEKAREYAAEKFKVNPESKKWNITTTYMSACEWKEQQFKEYLEKKSKELSENMTDEPFYREMVECSIAKAIYQEIINELFGGE